MATLNLVVSSRFTALLFLAAIAHCGVAQDSFPTNSFAAHAERAHVEARQRWLQDSNSAQLSWELGRACYDHADYATNNSQRAALAEEGMAACRHAIRLDTNSAPARYYLGLNTGQLARTK